MKERIFKSLNDYGVVILPPMDAFASLHLLQEWGIVAACTILDPWYNKGVGGTIQEQEYDNFIKKLLNESGKISKLIYLWGFPEIIGPYVRYAPKGFSVSAWLTWYYKNCPSVIRGWRSSQNACIQFMRDGYRMHPENFLNEEQHARFASGKMRFIPGPSSVIESPLIVGFVGKNERTGHPSQKPESVYDKLILMATTDGDLVIDPMAGSGTSAACAARLGRRCIVCDKEEAYIAMIENRLGVERLSLQH